MQRHAAGTQSHSFDTAENQTTLCEHDGFLVGTSSTGSSLHYQFGGTVESEGMLFGPGKANPFDPLDGESVTLEDRVEEVKEYTAIFRFFAQSQREVFDENGNVDPMYKAADSLTGNRVGYAYGYSDEDWATLGRQVDAWNSARATGTDEDPVSFIEDDTARLENFEAKREEIINSLKADLERKHGKKGWKLYTVTVYLGTPARSVESEIVNDHFGTSMQVTTHDQGDPIDANNPDGGNWLYDTQVSESGNDSYAIARTTDDMNSFVQQGIHGEVLTDYIVAHCNGNGQLAFSNPPDLLYQMDVGGEGFTSNRWDNYSGSDYRNDMESVLNDSPDACVFVSGCVSSSFFFGGENSYGGENSVASDLSFSYWYTTGLAMRDTESGLLSGQDDDHPYESQGTSRIIGILEGILLDTQDD